MKALLVAALLVGGLASSAQTTHYLDCNGGSDTADSLRPDTAWKSVARANAAELHAGDQLLLRRGSNCEGMLAPRGSGTPSAPIRVAAYGEGPLPVIHGGANRAALELHNQQYWEIAQLELTGGSPYGVHIGGSVLGLTHFHLRNLVVHSVVGEPASKDTGLIVVAPDDGSAATFNDVSIDGVTVYDTSEWAGIVVNGAGFDTANPQARGQGVQVRNSVVHDVAGDGILLARVEHGLLSHNVAWNTGMQETETIGTPDGIWEWMCTDCRVEYNEAFFTDSPGVDGGTFDIDYGNVGNTVEHNFGHDSQGYCVSVFGAEGAEGNSVNSVVRNNICLHNARSPRLARRQGAIFLDTWHGGKLNGVVIENNTVVWEPPVDAPAVQAKAKFFGDLPVTIAGNTIVAVSGSVFSALDGIDAHDNTVCSHERNHGEDSAKSEQLCACMSNQQKPHETATLGAPAAMHNGPSGHWELQASLPADPGEEASGGLVTLVKSMFHQYGPLGLHAKILLPEGFHGESAAEWRSDWNLAEQIEIATVRRSASPEPTRKSSAPLVLVSPDGKRRIPFAAPVEAGRVWLALQKVLGIPYGMQPLPSCFQLP